MVAISRATAKLVIGLTAIASGALVVYKILYDYFVGPRKTIEDTLKKLVETKIDYYTKAVTAQEGALTAQQQQYLDTLNKRIDEYSADVVAWGGDFSKLLQNLIIGGIGLGFAYVALRYGIPEIIKARKYVQDNVANVRTSAGFEAVMRCGINVSLAEAGQVSLAVAAQTSTEMWVSQALMPAMQSEVALLTAQMPTLVGTQLLWAQFMVASLQFQMATAVPIALTAAWVFITPLV